MIKYGKALLPILRNLKQYEYRANEFSLKIGKIVLNWDRNRVLAYTIDYNINKFIKYFTAEEDIDTLMNLLKSLYEHGYSFKDNFSLDEIDGISSILSLISLNGNRTSVEDAKKLFTKIMYYLYFKRDIDKDVKSIKDTGFVTLHNDCSIPTFIDMYLNYTNPLSSLNFENIKSWQQYKGFSSSINREICMREIKEDITEVHGREIIKLFSNHNLDMLNFVEQNEGIFKLCTFSDLISIIYDKNENEIGYRYLKSEKKNMKNISSLTFKSSYEILDFFTNKFYSFLNSNVKYIKDYNFGEGKKIDIFSKVMTYENQNDLEIAFDTIDDYLDFITIYLESGENKIIEELAKECIKSYSSFIQAKYENAKNNDDLYTINELRYLPAGFVKDVIDYIKTNNLNTNFYIHYLKIMERIEKIEIEGIEYPYYKEYYFKNILFENEFFKKYDINSTKFDSKLNVSKSFVSKDTIIKTPIFKNIKVDNQNTLAILTFNVYDNSYDYPKELYNTQQENIETLNRYFPSFKQFFVTIDEMVYSNKIVNNGSCLVYDFKGYVTDRILGEKLTEDVLKKLDNKSLAYLQVNLFKYFVSEYIPLEYIYFDPATNTIQINLLDGIIDIESKPKNKKFLNYIVEHLGYPDTILERVDSVLLDLKTNNQLNGYVSLFNGYCKKHNLYYSKQEKGCCSICQKYNFYVLEKYNKQLIMEDEGANYYKIEDKEETIFLKIFKNVEDCVEEDIYNLTSTMTFQMIQSLFVPQKIAIGENEKVIGYTYSYNKEADLFLDLRDNSISNIIKIKGCVLLLEKVIKMISNEYCFCKNPFGLVLFIQGYQEAVIPNTECIKDRSSEEDEKNTVKYTFEYIRSLLSEYKSINIDFSIIPETIGGMNEMKLLLDNYASTLTKKCRKHDYYEKKYLCCPYCVTPEKQNEIIKNAKFLDDNTFSEKINEGGESIVYNMDDGKVIKVFKSDEIDIDFKTKIIASLLEKNAELKAIEEKINDEGVYNFKYIIVDKMVIDRKSNTLHSCIMDKVNAMHVSILKNRRQVEEELNFSRKDIIELLINIGKGIEYLHQLDIFIGDLNGRNIMFDKSKMIYFIDFDGMSVNGLYPEFYTDKYVDPISRNNQQITKKDDWYSFAIQAFYYLTYIHPFNWIERDEDLDIVERMEQRKSIISSTNAKLPQIALDWNWMPDELINAFRETFEGNRRESLVPYLEKYYNIAYGNRYTVKNRADSSEDKKRKKYEILDITTSKYPNAYKIINHNAYIRENNGKYEIVVLNYNYNISIDLNERDNLVDVIVSGNNCYFIYKDYVNILSNNKLYHNVLSLNQGKVKVNSDTLYYLGKEDNILEIGIIQKNVLTNQHITFSNNISLLSYLVVEDSKYLTIQNDGTGNDKVYCNDEMFYEFEESKYRNYEIFYDKTTKQWLVCREDGIGIIIYNSGRYKNIYVPNVTRYNLKNIVWEYAYLYIPLKNEVLVYNTTSCEQKKISLEGIVGEEAKIKVENIGLEIIYNNKAYKCVFN